MLWPGRTGPAFVAAISAIAVYPGPEPFGAGPARPERRRGAIRAGAARGPSGPARPLGFDFHLKCAAGGRVGRRAGGRRAGGRVGRRAGEVSAVSAAARGDV